MDLNSLKQQNSRQSYVIKLLGEAINDENKRKDLLRQVEKHESSNNTIIDLQKQLTFLVTNMQAINKQQLSDREQELLQLIKIQETEYSKLTKQIEEYQRRAAEFEAEIERNEAEKQSLINNLRNRDSFQSPTSPNNKTNQELISLFGSQAKQDNDEELEQKIKEADEEIASLTDELDSLTKILEQKQEEYKEIQEKFMNQSL